MEHNELEDLSNYMRLSMYRDDGEMLLEEYQELEDIIKRNETVRKIEDFRTTLILNRIPLDEYDKMLMDEITKAKANMGDKGIARTMKR